MQDVTQKFTFYIHIYHFFMKTWEQFQMSTVKDFHQDIAVIEKRFKGKWSTGMLAEYCWSLKRDKPEQEHKR